MFKNNMNENGMKLASESIESENHVEIFERIKDVNELGDMVDLKKLSQQRTLKALGASVGRSARV